jgi:Dna[CI] antecedent, DciA
MGDILTAWEAAVGPEIARNAQPARFQRDGTLIVHAKDSVWAFELQNQSAQITARLPDRPPLKFVPGPLPEAGYEPPPATPKGSPPITLEAKKRAAEIASVVEDQELRDLIVRAIERSLG